MVWEESTRSWLDVQKSITVIPHINKLRKEKPFDQIISIEAEKKSFNKLQQPFMIEMLSKRADQEIVRKTLHFFSSPRGKVLKVQEA